MLREREQCVGGSTSAAYIEIRLAAVKFAPQCSRMAAAQFTNCSAGCVTHDNSTDSMQ